jgi:hypothetical protein
MDPSNFILLESDRNKKRLRPSKLIILEFDKGKKLKRLS